MPWKFSAIVLGDLASKSNSRRVTHWGGVIKSKKAMQFADDFFRQMRRPKEPFSGDVIFTCHVYYSSLRPDLDCTLLQDLLQDKRGRNGEPVGIGAIVDDRQIKEHHWYHHLDRKRPRVEFTLEEMP